MLRSLGVVGAGQACCTLVAAVKCQLVTEAADCLKEMYLQMENHKYLCPGLVYMVVDHIDHGFVVPDLADILGMYPRMDNFVSPDYSAHTVHGYIDYSLAVVDLVNILVVRLLVENYELSAYFE